MEANLHKSAHAHDMPDPQELACRAQAGSLSAFALLVERYHSGVFNFVFRRVGIVEDAKDMTQEAFGRAWRRINRYSPNWRFSTWRYTIGSRLHINPPRSRTLASSLSLVSSTSVSDNGCCRLSSMSMYVPTSSSLAPESSLAMNCNSISDGLSDH